MTNFTWSVTGMQCYPQAEGQVDVVFSVSWQCQGVEGNFAAVQPGTTSVTYTAGSPYTPYQDLTQEQVLGWVYATGVNQADVEQQVQTLLDLQINPPTVSLPLPWPQPTA